MTPTITTYQDTRGVAVLLDRLDPTADSCTIEGCVHHPAPRVADGGR